MVIRILTFEKSETLENRIWDLSQLPDKYTAVDTISNWYRWEIFFFHLLFVNQYKDELGKAELV